MFLTFRSQVPHQLRDPDAVQSLFKKYEILPYYGDEEFTSHSVLGVLADLTALSPSHTACKRDLKSYAFGGAVSAIKFGIPGTYVPPEEATLERSVEQSFFLRLVELGLPPIKLLDVTRKVFDSLKDCGNAYLLIKESRVGGSVRYDIQPWHFTQAAYLRKTDNGQRYIVLTKYWDESYWLKHKPIVLPASLVGEPYNWQGRRGGGLRQTVLHIKVNDLESDWYGRPDILSAMEGIYAEVRTLELNARISGRELVAKHLIAFEEVDPARQEGAKKKAPGSSGQEFKLRIQALRELTTQEGADEQVTGIVGIQYPHGGKPPKLMDFNVNRDVEYARWTVDNATSMVFSVNGWAKELTGQVPIKAGIGANMLYDLFLVKNVSTVKPLQHYYSVSLWADIFTNMSEAFAAPLRNITLQFPDLISEMVKSFNDAGDNPLEQGDNPLQRGRQSVSNLRP